MPDREDLCASILKLNFGEGNFPKPTYNDFFDSNFQPEITDTYQKLDGQLKIYPTGFKKFDIQLTNCIVELDEEQHFNRYRLITLSSSIYNQTKSFSVSDYKNFCSKFENECLKKADNRKYWTTSSTEKQFGKSSPAGVLTGFGSSRWRQRAFYDYLKDIGQNILDYKLVRISIHQKVKDRTVNEILSKKLGRYYDGIFDIVDEAIQD